MKPGAELASLISRMDGRSYNAYRGLAGAYRLGDVTLYIDHVQGDPFAAPSRVRARIDMQVAALPGVLHDDPVRRVALADALTREIKRRLGEPGAGGGSGSSRSGLINIDVGGQVVLERTSVVIEPGFVEARLEVGLPAAGRRILAREAERLLCERVPGIAMQALCWASLPQPAIAAHVSCIENQAFMRGQLAANGLVAFVANGSMLPRASGDSDLPMPVAQGVAFESPPSLETELELRPPLIVQPGGAVERATDAVAPRTVRGMGVPAGITLVVGGGYHGKSTLLQAIEHAVYPHVPGDGREGVVASKDLVKVRAEDGRPVTGVDLRPFIGSLPAAGGTASRSTAHFTTGDASGSTSQAASMLEAIEAGATGLLLDEDTCATNFMVRDARMQALVADEDEPITPLSERIGALSRKHHVSCVLVMGGSGDYFGHADTVIRMRNFRAEDVTAQAQAIAAESPTATARVQDAAFLCDFGRVPVGSSLSARQGRKRASIKVRGRAHVQYGERDLDLDGVAHLADPSQVRAIAHALVWAAEHIMPTHMEDVSDASPNVCDVLDDLMDLIDEGGLDTLALHASGLGEHPGNLARPRRHEIAAALNRMRGLRIA